MLRKMVIVGLLLGVLVNCGPQAPAEQTSVEKTQVAIDACKSDVAAYKTTMQPTIDKWNDAVKLAGQTSRVALASQISELQAIKREATSVVVAECIKSTHDYFTSSMDDTIEAFLAFLSQKSEPTIQQHFESPAAAMTNYNTQIEILTTGVVPTPVPTVRALSRLTPADLESIAWDNDIKELTIRDGSEDISNILKGFIHQVKRVAVNDKDKIRVFLTLANYNNHTDAQAEVKKISTSMKTTFGTENVTLVTDVGDPLYVASDPKKERLSNFIISRCGVVVLGVLNPDFNVEMVKLAHSIDDRIKAKCDN